MTAQPRRTVDVVGVQLPADELADAIRAYASNRLMADRRRKSGAPWPSAPWAETARRLSASAHFEPEKLRTPRMLSVNEYADRTGRPPVTVRRWAAKGRLPGARQIGRQWLIPADAQPTKGTGR